MANGGKIKLAGIELAPEGRLLLFTLLADREVYVEYERSSSASSAKDAYVYIPLQQLPEGSMSGVTVYRRMLNQVLIQMGAARVDLKGNFKFKRDFLKLEAEAKRKGEGVWSYEEIPPKAKKKSSTEP